MSFSPPGAQQAPAPVIPQQPAPPPAFGLSPVGQRPQAKAMQPTFLGAGLTANPTNTGNKTLIGQ